LLDCWIRGTTPAAGATNYDDRAAELSFIAAHKGDQILCATWQGATKTFLFLLAALTFRHAVARSSIRSRDRIAGFEEQLAPRQQR